MDHLPPVVGAHSPITIPYLGHFLEGHGFTSFPVPQGVDLEVLGALDASAEDSKHAAPYLQDRFFFGIMHEVLRVSIDLDDWVNTCSGGQYITTARLTSYLRYWRFSREIDKASSTNDRSSSNDAQAVRCLKLSYECWQAIPHFASIVTPEVELSIQLVACALEHALWCVADVDVNDLPWRQTRSDFVFNRMLKDGWCPSLAWQMGSSQLTWQYYASLLGPPTTRKSHERCTKEDRCLVDRRPATDKENASQHVCDNQLMCHETKPDGELIANIVRRGGVPLLEYVDDMLHVTQYTRTTHYTAISHVWTDGLGNPGANSMPVCQLDRINKSMRMLPWTNKCFAESLTNDRVWLSDDSVVELTPDEKSAAAERPLLFWIDTICVPREDVLRKLAVSNMRAIYNRANRVLVFDADLAGVQGRLSGEEILTRISLSKWIRRFWTLQEAVLAKVLWFRFGDECYRQMLDGITVKESTWLNEVSYYCNSFDFNWRSRAMQSADRTAISYPLKVTCVWNELSRRESSFEEDQPVCIATLLDMDLAEIQKPIGFAARCRRLWLMYESVPKRVLFLPGPRLLVHPLRWAPDGFHDLNKMPVPPGIDEGAQPTPEGLRVQHHGLIARTGSISNIHGFIGLRLGENVYLVRENLKRGNPSWEGLDFACFEHIAVLLAQNEMQHETDKQPFVWSLGALVGVSSMVAHAVLRCEYLRTVSVLRRGTAFEKNYRATHPLRIDADREDDMVAAAWWSLPRQAWLIS